MNDIFTNYLPSIDLHGEDRVNALIKVDEFINDSIKLKHKKIIVIHGKGSWVLKDSIHNYLKKDSRVEEYSLDINTGQTIISLKID
ncbi:MAG: Smr/MutS family protein [Bacilli bacterium]|jgi:DNA mismatch repair protein MutS2|nr:Smr/MutS family protein [Bacilli bacterium]